MMVLLTQSRPLKTHSQRARVAAARRRILLLSLLVIVLASMMRLRA